MRHPSFRQIGRGAAIVAFALSAGAATAMATGFCVNVTRSIPLGVYRKTSDAIRPGDYVSFCPPSAPLFHTALERRYVEPGSCPGGSYPMVKRLLAAKNDVVRIGVGGVSINGKTVPLSQPRPFDGAHRPLPQISYAGRLGDDQVIVMGENAISFDSRYFGPIPRSQISAVIRPVVTW